MNDLVLNPKTRDQITAFVANPSHASILTGAEGAGKSYVARIICAQILDISGGDIQKHPYVKVIKPSDNALSIETIRDLRSFLRLKTTGGRALRRAALIEHADTLTLEAQNALLKILEEPPDDTILILTASHSRSLLPTILSRTREIRLRPPGFDQLIDFFSKNHSLDRVKQAYFLSGGLPGLMHSLLNEQDGHPLTNSVNFAKDILKQSQFERLAAMEGLSKQKEVAAKFIEALQRISNAGLHLAAQKQDTEGLKRWHRLYKLSLKSGDSLSKNANAKLVLTDLMLQM